MGMPVNVKIVAANSSNRLNRRAARVPGMAVFRIYHPIGWSVGHTDRERRPFRGLHTYQQLSHLDGDFDGELAVER